MTNLDKIIADPNNVTFIRDAVEEYFECHMSLDRNTNRLRQCNDIDCANCGFKSEEFTCSAKSIEWLHEEAKDGENLKC